ncbi:MAG: DUF2071 domain-containing protein [Acidobacteria bacterium]|nr:DUF2071 domain-containing protein [Acidobacteriota bacterium]
MSLPVVEGVIRRRVLVNFRVDAEVMRRQLPARFAPKLHAGYAVAGICLIRLEEVRPKTLPRAVGVSSENVAHRVAVRWVDDDGAAREGVYIPRRDTGSRLNHLAGGRLFPGEQHLASFAVGDDEKSIHISVRSRDSTISVEIAGRVAESLPPTSIFGTLAEASAFFEAGSLGYSVTSEAGRLDGIELATRGWRVEPLALDKVYSSYFADESKFPRGSVEFDHALIMRDVAHEWRGAPAMHV